MMEHDPELVEAVRSGMNDDRGAPTAEEAKAAITAVRAYDATNQRQDDRRFTAACAAMQGLLASDERGEPNWFADEAVDYADALIAALEKPHD